MRALYADTFRCRHCGFESRRVRQGLGALVTFVFSRYSRCIQCGTLDVQRLAKPDRVDWMSRHPLSLLMYVTGAPLNRCSPCRLQYHDWRPIVSKSAGGRSQH